MLYLSFCCTECGIFGSLTRDGTVPSAVEAQSLNHWTAREVRDCMLRETDFT